MQDNADERTLHVPPDAHELPTRIDALCAFANERTGDAFVHPVIRAIVLHFALAYDHPFVDGNGRTARALFYWSMIGQGYWPAGFLSISRIIQKAPAQYSRAFLYTETDGSDLTYFLLHQLEVIRKATQDLLDLEKAGYLMRTQVGRAFRFAPVPDLERLLRKRSPA